MVSQDIGPSHIYPVEMRLLAEHPVQAMRIAVSGTDLTGKTTLVGELVASLPMYSAVEEPYYLLEDEGHLFGEEPGVEDFELQLKRSVEAILESGTNCVFDRCPLDMLAYLIVYGDPDRFDVNKWLPSLRDVMGRLDLLVFVPIEVPERVSGTGPDDRNLRMRVNEEMSDIVLNDLWEFGVPVIEVSGPTHERTGQVMAYLRDKAGL